MLPIEKNASLGPQPSQPPKKKNQSASGVNPPAANYVPPDPATQHVQQSKPLQINQRDVEHPTVTPSIPQKTLDVLQATGFVGNGIGDFNTQVARIWKTYSDALGQPPTPGLIMDLLKSPSSYDPNEINKLWEAANAPPNLSPSFVGQQQAHHPELDQSSLTAGAMQEAKDKAVKATMGYEIVQHLANPYSQPQDVLPALQRTQSNQKNNQAFIDYAATGNAAPILPLVAPLDLNPGILSAPAGMLQRAITLMSTKMVDKGYTPDTLNGFTLAQVKTALETTSPQTFGLATSDPLGAPAAKLTTQGAADLVAQYQQKLIDFYHLKGVTANGIITTDWAKAFNHLQSDKSYVSLQAAVAAKDAGFGSFDPYSAIDPATGQYKDNADGQAARSAINSMMGKIAAKTSALKNANLLTNVTLRNTYENLPLQMFGDGPTNISPVDTIKYILADEQGWSIYPTTWGGHLESILPRTAGIFFDAASGGMQQLQTDTYAGEAFLPSVHNFNGDFHSRTLHEAIDESQNRLLHTHPGLLGIFLNNEHLAESTGQFNNAFNVVASLVLFRKLPFWATDSADLSALGAAARSGDPVTAYIAAMKSVPVRYAANAAYSALRKGDIGGAQLAVKGSQAAHFITGKIWKVDNEGFVSRVPRGEGDSLAKLVEDGKVDQAGFQQATGSFLAQTQGILTKELNFNLPSKTVSWTRHPIHTSLVKTGDAIHGTLNAAEDTLGTHPFYVASRLSYLGDAIRVARVSLDKFPQSSPIAYHLVDPRVVYRAARMIGTKDSEASVLQDRFIELQGNDNRVGMAQFNDELRAEARKRGWGRDTGIGAEKNLNADINKEGEVVEGTKRQAAQAHAKDLMDNAETPEEIAASHYLMEEANKQKDEPFAAIRENQPLYWSFPELQAGKAASGIEGVIRDMNKAALKATHYFKNTLLASNFPAQFIKHSFTDFGRAFLATNPLKLPFEAKWRDEVDNIFSKNARARAEWEMRYKMSVGSEQHWAADELPHGETSLPTRLRTGDILNDEHYRPKEKKAVSKAAADYLHRRIITAYPIWNEYGLQGLVKYYSEGEGKSLAETEGLSPTVMATAVDRQMRQIGTDTLERAQQIARDAKFGKIRDDLAKWIYKEKPDFPVSARVAGEDMPNLFDLVTGKAIGWGLSPNKAARKYVATYTLYHAYGALRKAGWDKDAALNGAMDSATSISRQYMFDFADQLTAERQLRYFSLFFTKHRLYFQFLLRQMANYPGRVAAATTIFNQINSQHEKDPHVPFGTLSVNLPFDLNLPKLGNFGNKVYFPLARIMWLTASAQDPGPVANTISAIGNGGWKGFGMQDWGFTTVDAQLRVTAMWLQAENGKRFTADEAAKGMSPYMAEKFRSYLGVYEAEYAAAHPGAKIPEAQLVQDSLRRLGVGSLWQQWLVAGGYPAAPTLRGPEQKAWNAYITAPTDAARSKILRQNPYLGYMLGVQSTNPTEKIQEAQYWDKFQSLMGEWDQAKAAIYKTDLKNGNMMGLFDSKWHAMNTHYEKLMDDLMTASKTAAPTWYKKIHGDPFSQIVVQFGRYIRGMGTNLPQDQVDALLKKSGSLPPDTLQEYKRELSPGGILSLKTISGLTNDLSRTAAENQRETALSLVREFGGHPDTPVDKIRADYFANVYDPWQAQRQKILREANTATQGTSGPIFARYNAFIDASDHPYTVRGVEFPSPIRTHFAMLSPDLRKAYMQRIYTTPWSYLPRFDKSLLGVKVTPEVQKGWVDWYKIGGDYLQSQYLKTGKYPTIDDHKLLSAAAQIDQSHPGFLADYTRSVLPPYVRLAEDNIGDSPASQRDFKTFLGVVSQWGVAMGGGPMPPQNDPVKLVDWAANFRGSKQQAILTRGIKGESVPLATKGGLLYTWVMDPQSSFSPDFRKEFKAWMDTDPNFIVNLFPPSYRPWAPSPISQ